MSNPSYTRRSVPVDSKRGDWPRLVADDLNSIVRAYIFTMFFTTTPTASEVLWIHPVGIPFSIPADWGPMITDAVPHYAAIDYTVGTNPAASFAMDVQRKPVGAAWATMGTWTLSTGGVLTAVTAGNAQIDFVRGDGFRVIAPSIAVATVANVAFTVRGMRA